MWRLGVCRLGDRQGGSRDQWWVVGLADRGKVGKASTTSCRFLQLNKSQHHPAYSARSPARARLEPGRCLWLQAKLSRPEGAGSGSRCRTRREALEVSEVPAVFRGRTAARPRCDDGCELRCLGFLSLLPGDLGRGPAPFAGATSLPNIGGGVSEGSRPRRETVLVSLSCQSPLSARLLTPAATQYGKRRPGTVVIAEPS